MPKPAAPQRGLARAVRALRADRNLSQEDLAAAAGIDVTALRRIEGGGNPTLATLRALAAALGISLTDLAREIERCDSTAGS